MSRISLFICIHLQLIKVFAYKGTLINVVDEIKNSLQSVFGSVLMISINFSRREFTAQILSSKEVC